MREKKYANILDDQEEIKTSEISNEEKLSMTRELKFKELQDAIDKDSELKEKAQELKEDDFATFIEENANANLYTLMNEPEDIEVEAVPEQNTGEIEVKSEIKIDEVENDDGLESTDEVSIEQLNNKANDDIYLTTSFQPLKKKFRISKVFKFFFNLVLIVGLLGAFGYFILKPMYEKYVASKPVVIFENTIKYVFDNTLEIYNKNSVQSGKYYYDFNFKIDSNNEMFDQLNDNIFGYKMGIDVENKVYEDFVYLKENGKDYGLSYIENNNNYFYKYSNSSNYIKMINDDKENDYFKDKSSVFDSYSKLKNDDLEYFITKQRDILISLLDENLITSESDVLEINDKEVNVIRNTLTLKKSDLEQSLKKYKEKSLEDERYLEIIKKLYSYVNDKEITEKEFEKIIDSYITEIEDDYKLVINLYTIKGTQVVGFDIEENGFRNIYLYFKDGSFDGHFNLTTNEECSKEKDCTVSSKQVIDIYGIKEDAYTNVDIKYNDEKVANLKVKSFDLEKIELDYEVSILDKKIKGDILLFVDFDTKVYNLDFACKYDSNYFNINVNFDINTDLEVGNIDLNKIVEYTDDVYEQEETIFNNLMNNLGINETYNYWYKTVNNPLVLIQDFQKTSVSS